MNPAPPLPDPAHIEGCACPNAHPSGVQCVCQAKPGEFVDSLGQVANTANIQVATFFNSKKNERQIGMERNRFILTAGAKRPESGAAAKKDRAIRVELAASRAPPASAPAAPEPAASAPGSSKFQFEKNEFAPVRCDCSSKFLRNVRKHSTLNRKRVRWVAKYGKEWRETLAEHAEDLSPTLQEIDVRTRQVDILNDISARRVSTQNDLAIAIVLAPLPTPTRQAEAVRSWSPTRMLRSNVSPQPRWFHKPGQCPCNYTRGVHVGRCHDWEEEE